MKKQSTEEKVYLRIRRAITARQLPPGQQLIENTISAQLGISRSPVRNALQRLAQEGYVKMIKNRGAFVANPSREEMQQAYSLRKLLEKTAAEQAVGKMAAADFRLLRDIVEAEKLALQKDDPLRYLDLNKQFHMHIAGHAGNRLLAEFIERLINETNIYVILFDSFFIEHSYQPRGTSDHLAIIRHLEEQDVPALLEAIDSHFDNAVEGTKKRANSYKNLDQLFGSSENP